MRLKWPRLGAGPESESESFPNAYIRLILLDVERKSFQISPIVPLVRYSTLRSKRHGDKQADTWKVRHSLMGFALSFPIIDHSFELECANSTDTNG